MPEFLRAVRRDPNRGGRGYPFDLPLIERFERLDFPQSVTFFVGENGSGKSTLLEAIAIACDAAAAGSTALAEDATLEGPRRLAEALVTEKGGRARSRFFLRAEDVFGFASRVDREAHELAEQERAVLDEGPIAPGSGRARARGVFSSSRRAFEEYGEDPHARSHGETFLAVLRRRFVPQGLYFLDEPEKPLSPSRVLALIAMILEGVREGSQFVIATHSPILMAVPEATIYGFEDGRIAPVAWDDVEHVSMTRAFLRNPAGFLRHL